MTGPGTDLGLGLAVGMPFVDLDPDRLPIPVLFPKYIYCDTKHIAKH